MKFEIIRHNGEETDPLTDAFRYYLKKYTAEALGTGLGYKLPGEE